MTVLDASALLELLTATPAGHRIGDYLEAKPGTWHVPHIADLEVAQVLRRSVQSAAMTADAAAGTLRDYRALGLHRHDHESLLDRIWELRDNLTAYDAAYVALAESLEAELLTCDGALARAPGVYCQVRLVS